MEKTVSSKTEVLTCVGCSITFHVTAHEVAILKQQFGVKYKTPIRCPDCRRKGRKGRLGHGGVISVSRVNSPF